MAGIIPFFNLQAVHKEYINELNASAATIIQSGNYILGTSKFEEEFANYVGSSYTACVASGTAALHLAIKALDIKPGDEIITVGYTFRATVSAIMYEGAIPVYVDIDPETFCMDVSKVEEKITEKTKCIIPVHLFGNAVDMPELMKIADKYGIPVIEDCSQAHGTTINGKHVGTFGVMGTFSFYPSKNIGALGDAGCIITNVEKHHDKVKRLRNWEVGDIGYNYRMDNIQAEFLSVKLKHYNSIMSAKKDVAAEYNKHFSNIKTKSGVNHSYNIYTILVNNREEFIKKINDKLQTRVYYDIPVSNQSPYIFNMDNLETTNRLAKKQLSLPIYPTLNVNKVIEIIKENIDDNLCSIL
jgi:dTDP-4-amino-4,6-dideoxygalactose transaminase